MNLEQSYETLNVKPGASLQEIKTSYRKLAFQFHPDLNQDDPEASRKFQAVNQAYVLLSTHVKKDTEPSGAREKQKRRDQTKAREKKQEFRSDNYRFFNRREEILKNILNDPFAKKVFDDIYRELRKSSQTSRTSGQKKTQRQHSVQVDLGRKQYSRQMRNGVLPTLKQWFLRQLDDEQEVVLPPSKILPGSKIHIEIQHRWSGPPKSIEVTLPKDYVVGRPVRLRGLGKKLGPWTGDLYLRLSAG